MSGELGYLMGKVLRAMFPEQTKSIPAIIVWTIIFVLDVVLVFWLAEKLSIDIRNLARNLSNAGIMLYLLAALAIFWLEATVYNKIVSLFR